MARRFQRTRVWFSERANVKLSKARVYELLARSATPRLPRVVRETESSEKQSPAVGDAQKGRTCCTCYHRTAASSLQAVQKSVSGTESGREPSSLAHQSRTCRMFTALSASPSTLMARARLWYAAGGCTISGTELSRNEAVPCARTVHVPDVVVERQLVLGNGALHLSHHLARLQTGSDDGSTPWKGCVW